MSDPDIHDNAEAGRYELEVEGEIAFAAYNLSPLNLMITKTSVPSRLEGRGIAGRLTEHLLKDARTRGLMVLPVCSYVARYLQKHPEFADVVHPTYRDILGLPRSVLNKD